MHDTVTRETKLNVTKEIVCSVIKTAIKKDGEHQQSFDMSNDDICKLIKKVYETVDNVVPVKEKKVGLGV